MELKLQSSAAAPAGNARSNRTFMELKYEKITYYIVGEYGF